MEYEPIRTHVGAVVNVTEVSYRMGMITRFAVTPALPSSLVLDEATGFITGTVDVGLRARAER